MHRMGLSLLRCTAVQSLSVSGCAGATGDLWDALHVAAVEALGPGRNDPARSAGAGCTTPSESQSDMDVDTLSMSASEDGAAAAGTVVRWSGGKGTAVDRHPPQHALTTLSAVRCTSMRTCRVGLARSDDPAREGAHLLDMPLIRICQQVAMLLAALHQGKLATSGSHRRSLYFCI